MGHLTLRCIHCGASTEHHLNDGKAPDEHVHRFTVPVEWWEGGRRESATFDPLLIAGIVQVRVVRLRCESCDAEVERQ
jgi:hypothetical protein